MQTFSVYNLVNINQTKTFTLRGHGQQIYQHPKSFSESGWMSRYIRRQAVVYSSIAIWWPCCMEDIFRTSWRELWRASTWSGYPRPASESCQVHCKMSWSCRAGSDRVVSRYWIWKSSVTCLPPIGWSLRQCHLAHGRSRVWEVFVERPWPPSSEDLGQDPEVDHAALMRGVLGGDRSPEVVSKLEKG